MDRRQNNLVDFLCVGGMKCGTTSFYQGFKQHPQLALTKGKEAKFFNHPITEARIQWYHERFGEDAGRQRGDVDPEYAMRHRYPETVSRIKKFAPNAKVIYIVRDPIERLISHLQHDMLKDRLNRATFESALMEPQNTYVNTSQYHYQIQPFVEALGTESIVVLSFEHMLADPAAFIERVCVFLNITNHPAVAFSKANTSSSRYVIKYHDTVHRHIDNLKILKLYHKFWRIFNLKVKRPDISNVYELIHERLSPDVQAFQQLFPHIQFKNFPNREINAASSSERRSNKPTLRK